MTRVRKNSRRSSPWPPSPGSGVPPSKRRLRNPKAGRRSRRWGFTNTIGVRSRSARAGLHDRQQGGAGRGRLGGSLAFAVIVVMLAKAGRASKAEVEGLGAGPGRVVDALTRIFKSVDDAAGAHAAAEKAAPVLKAWTDRARAGLKKRAGKDDMEDVLSRCRSRSRLPRAHCGRRSSGFTRSQTPTPR